MKRVILTIALLSTSAPAIAAKCHSGQMGFQELTYVDKKQLIREYCFAAGVSKIYDPGPSASVSELRDYSDRLGACADYLNQISRVLKKDHDMAAGQINNIRCDE